MKIVGIAPTSFKGSDDKQVKGASLYVTEPLDAEKGTGERTDKLFLTEKKLADLDFSPSVGDEIIVYYNRFGKPEKIVKNDEINF